MNHLHILLNLLPEEDWDYRSLSENPLITYEFVKSKPKEFFEKLDKDKLIQNASFTLDQLKDLGLDVEGNPCVLLNPNIDFDYAIGFIEKYEQKKKGSLTDTLQKMLYCLSNKEAGFVWSYFCKNKGLTLENIERLIEMEKCCFISISSNKNITIPFIRKYLDKFKNVFNVLSIYVDFKDIEQNLDLPWRWGDVSRNHTIPLKKIIDTFNIYEWNQYSLLHLMVYKYQQEDIDIDEVKKVVNLLDKYYQYIFTYYEYENEINYSSVSITWDQVYRTYTTKDWNFSKLSEYPTFQKAIQNESAKKIQKVWFKYWYEPYERDGEMVARVAQYHLTKTE